MGIYVGNMASWALSVQLLAAGCYTDRASRGMEGQTSKIQDSYMLSFLCGQHGSLCSGEKIAMRLP
jgi:hypothetical protein